MKSQKKITIFALLIMLCNFFMPSFAMVADASNSNLVLDKIVSMSSDIETVNTLITNTKNDEGFSEDKSLQVATTYFSNSFLEVVNEFNETKEMLNEGIKLSELVAYANDEVLTEKYTKYINSGNTDFDLDISDLKDIAFVYEYVDEYENPQSDDIILLTVTEQETLIINKYLGSISLEIDSYDSNKLLELKNHYNDIISDIDLKITNLDSIVSLIEQYEEDELLLGNNPNMIVENKNIYDLFEDYNNLLETLKEEVDLTNDIYINEQLIDINSKYNNLYNEFTLNNSDFTSLSSEIGTLETEYLSNIDKLNAYLTNNSLTLEDLLSDDFKDYLSEEFITITEEFKILEEKYNSLLEKTNAYLERRSSDKELVENELKDLNTLLETYNIEYFSETLNNLVDNILTDEDKIDVLLTSTLLSENNVNILKDAKLSFYEITLKSEENYKMTLSDNYMIIKDLLKLDIDELFNNIKYDYVFSLTEEENIYYLTFNDKNDKELIKYQVLVKNDLNNDYEVNTLDLGLLRELLIKEELSDIEKLISDVNDDEVLNIKDVTDLENILNNTYIDSISSTANFRIEKEEKNNEIIYKVYLETDGVVNGFEFDFEASSDLTFKNYETPLELLINNIDNPSKIISNGIFNNETLVIKLVYTLNDEGSLKTTFLLKNGLVIYDNGNTTSDISNLDIITRVEEVVNEQKTEEKPVILTNNEIEDDTYEEPLEEEKTEQKTEITYEEIKEEPISISNVIKVVFIILLGILIIYFLNKTEEQEDKKEFLNDKKNKESNK